jgi:hypothetical protein
MAANGGETAKAEGREPAGEALLLYKRSKKTFLEAL